MKVAFLDLETHDLDADDGVGFILCAVYQCEEIGVKSGCKKIVRIDESKKYRECLYDDALVVQTIYGWLETDQPDFLVTWNGDRFDIPYLRSRALNIRNAALPAFRSMDHWKTARYSLKLRNARLDTVARHLNLPMEKTRVDKRVWQRAAYGDKKALDEIVHHCKLDVDILKACHAKLVPLLRTMRGIY